MSENQRRERILSISLPRPQPAGQRRLSLFNGYRLRKVARKIDVEAFPNGEPVCNQLQWNNVEKSLEAVHGLGNLDLLRLGRRELGIAVVTDHNGATTPGNHCKRVRPIPSGRKSKEIGRKLTLLIGIQ